MSNIAAIDNKQHGRANNEKLKLETLVRSVGANLQATIQIINSLWIKKGWKSLKRAEILKSQKTVNRFSSNRYFENNH